MNTLLRFIIIDDDFANNLLCSIVIEEVAGEVKLEEFQSAEKGFEYIKKEYSINGNPTILFLDINMPTWSGWDFLENFETLAEHIKNHFKIYMLSSSLDPGDQQRALQNINVVNCIEKPLCEKKLLSILQSQQQVEWTW